MKKVYGVDSNEYREWQASLEAAAKGWRESETAAYDLQRSFLDLNAQVMNFDITKLQHGIERIANAVSLKSSSAKRIKSTEQLPVYPIPEHSSTAFYPFSKE